MFTKAREGTAERPLLTFYDDATGERTELSGITLDNWVAKTANLLVDGCGLGAGDTATVLLPAHWQTAAVLLGCWSAGLRVDLTGAVGGADVAFTGEAGATPGEAGASTGEAPAASVEADERFVLGLAPMALPMRSVPDGCQDYIAEVRGHGDRFQPYQPVTDGQPALTDATHGELAERATARAAELGLHPGARVLVDAAAFPDPVDWLLAPLAAGASIVLCTNTDPDVLAGRADAEMVTRTLDAPSAGRPSVG